MAAFLEKVLGEKYKKELTHDELDKLIEAIYNELVKEKDSFKAASDKNASEAASWKKQYTEKLTEAEKKELEYQELVKKNNELTRESNISKYTAQYIGLGYDEKLAKSSAIAQIDGDFETVFANQKAFNDKVKADFEKQKLEGTPTPPNGDGKKITKEEFNKMNYSQMCDLAEKDPVLFAELSK